VFLDAKPLVILYFDFLYTISIEYKIQKVKLVH